MTQTTVTETKTTTNKGASKKPYKRQVRCPYCKERDSASLERKGRLLVCYTCGNDSDLY